MSAAEEAGATPEELIAEATANTESDGGAGGAVDLAGALESAGAAETIFRSLAKRVTTQENDLERREAALRSAREELDTRKADLDKERKEAAGSLAEARQLNAGLDARAEELDRRAAEAEAGFLARKDEILRPMREKIAELTAAWQSEQDSMVEQWRRATKETSEEIRAEHDRRWAEVAADRAELDGARRELDRRSAEVRRAEQDVQLAQDLLEEDRAQLAADRTEAAERAEAEWSTRLRQSSEREQRLLQRNEELEARASTALDVQAELGGDPAAVVDELRTLRARAKKLEKELAARPEAHLRDELDDARQGVVDARRERDDALRSQRELQRQLDAQANRIHELEQVDLVNQTLESVTGAYRTEIAELRAQFEGLREKSDSVTAFPQCRKLDADFGASASRQGEVVTDLEGFADEMRYRMAEANDASQDGRRLNYRPEDIRLFIAGLAMSRLHLLEGVSGTGKTTLPHAFANAVGGGVQKIEVQAGWRDKQDLLGYYNSFERVFRETACLQALYKALLPPFSDRLIFVVLDEMNLSHPEQYFADFLSALEDPKAQPKISIADRSDLGDMPELMGTSGGVQLLLAPNVWFIGTANQDETTFAFAPKTYDRAHIMELEPNAPPTPDRPAPPRGPVSLASLKDAFGQAKQTHHREAETAAAYVRDELAPFFASAFRVGWGNRLDVHVRSFVPVDIAAGGTFGEALDHLVATKVFRKVQGWHSLRRDSLEELRSHIDRTWPDRNHHPSKTIAAIEHEIEVVV